MKQRNSRTKAKITRDMHVIVPLGHGGRQFWAMGFMRRGALLCTPALPELFETTPLQGRERPANCHRRLKVVV